MVDIKEVKTKILNFITRNGPSLPIQIAKEMNMNSIFVSAFLSELIDDKKVKMSSLKVGGTHLYMLDNQEQQLEKFHIYFHPKEIEAFQLLKENKILEDSKQDPAIRVALRAIKDFAIGFKLDEEIYWRYVLVPEQEVIQIIDSRIQKSKQKVQSPEPVDIQSSKSIDSETVIKRPLENIKPEPSKESISKSEIQEEKSKPIKKKEKSLEKPIEKIDFENPLAIHSIEKPKKEKTKSDFVLDVIKFLEKNNLKILEEKEHKAKEYLCITEMQTELGPIAFLTQAKDKKSVSDTDLNSILRQAQTLPLPALFLTPGNLTKKALEYQQKYYSIIKVKKME